MEFVKPLPPETGSPPKKNTKMSKGVLKMIRISKSAIEELKRSNQSTEKNWFRVVISGMG
jgi:hypothetical protein